MVYASATRGFKSGGFQLGDGRPFLPEYVWSYEVGLKSTLLDRRLRANFSAFYYDYTNLQVVEYNRSEEHTSELQSLMRISYAVFCLKKKKKLTSIQKYIENNT